jgi:hypothetical protein
MQVQEWIIKENLSGVCSLIAQVHDAGLFLGRNSELAWLIPELVQRIVYPVDFGSTGIMSIPADAQVGKRWSKAKNKPGLFDGLKDWKA